MRSRKFPFPLTIALVVLAMLASACADDGESDIASDAAGDSATDTTGESANGSGTATPAGDCGTDEVLRVAWRANPSSLDPQRGNSGSDHSILYTLYDTLISFDPETMEPVPGLVESWDQSDPSVLILNLREGVTFHDGTPLDAEAVKYNIERAKGALSNIQADLVSVESVEVVDDLQVKLNLNQPDTSLPLTLADRAGMMISPTAAEAAGEGFELNPVGTGPWKFVEWRNGESVRVERYEDYWQEGLPHLAGIDFTIMTDASTAVNALRSGQIDMMFEPAAQDIDAFEASSDFKVSATPQLYQNIMYINVATPPFDDAQVRRALNHAVDREAVQETTLFGRGEVGWTSLPSAHWAHPAELVPTYEHDPELARQLLAEAGHPDGVSFQMPLYPNPVDIRRGEVIKAQLAEAGFNVELVPTELTQATDEFFNNQQYPIYLSAWTGRPDPALTFKLMFTEEGYYNAGHVATPGLDEALQAANATSDLDERAEHLADAAAAVADAAMFVPLVYPPAVAISTDEVEGYVPNLLGKPKFTSVQVCS